MKNNDELNAVSLGNVDNSSANNSEPSINTPPLEVNNASSSTPEVNNQEETLDLDKQPEVSNNPMPDVPLEPVAPINYDVPEVISNVNETPFLNEIGTVPPIANIPDVTPPPIKNEAPTTGEQGSKTNKLLFIIVIVLALTAVGVGVYIFLTVAKRQNAPAIIAKDVKIELGEEISLNIDDYVTLRKIAKDTCSLDTSKLKSDELGAKYEFSVTCNDIVRKGTATVVDTVKPVVKVKDVQVGVKGNLDVNSFIASCEDATECFYAFENEDEVKKNLETAGDYIVTIIVKDTSNNETKVKAKLNVSDTVADLYLNCSNKTDEYSVVTKYGIKDSEFNKTGIRIYTFTLTEEEYNTLKNGTTGNEITYKDITGTYEFRDDDKTLNITKIMSYEELVAEAGSELPSTGGELRDFYNNRGDVCTIGY